jgi:integrase
LRIGTVQRDTGASIKISSSVELPWKHVVSTLDRLDVPDGTPFVVDEDGSLGCLANLNHYLLEASRQGAYRGNGLRQNHVSNLVRLLRFTRSRHGRVDLTATTRADLIAYRDSRRPELAPTSWNTELSAIAQFFSYAKDVGWISSSPVPTWGTRNRSTLNERISAHRRERFLSESQSRFFLEVGLRGDAPSPPELRPRNAERDYTYGLTLLSTGLRRQEANLLLNSEIPTAASLHPRGVESFVRTGKGGVQRDVWVTDALVDVIDLYRATERERVIRAAQPRLRLMRRNGSLLMADGDPAEGEHVTVSISGKKYKAENISDELRAITAYERPDGVIEPLTLFVVEGGRAPALKTANQIFNDAMNRVSGMDHPDRPPAHIEVTPHVFRHTFAVRMLAALMRQGLETAGNPYELLASPIFVVQELLGHANIETTHRYLFAAERYSEQLPTALREAVAMSLIQRQAARES